MNNTDIFDKLFCLPFLNKLQPFYKKNKEILLYLFFGALTTFVSIFVFWFFTTIIPLNELVANVISWVIAVLFAFVTNRKWVFSTAVKENILKATAKFYCGRISTLVIEEIILFIFITVLQLNAMAVKIVTQLIVIILNYIVSKKFIFKTKK